MGTITPLRDRIEDRRKVIELAKQPRWIERRMAERRGQSPWVAIKDTSEWRPEPAA